MHPVRMFVLLQLVLLSALVHTPCAAGENLLMARSPLEFPEAMLTLQESIRAHQYVLARVQRVDIGLTQAGYSSDKYRVVFYGNPQEVRELTRKYPELVPLLPLNFSIFAENGETLVVAMNPSFLGDHFTAPELNASFARWESDVRSILADLRRADDPD